MNISVQYKVRIWYNTLDRRIDGKSCMNNHIGSSPIAIKSKIVYEKSYRFTPATLFVAIVYEISYTIARDMTY